MATWPPPDRPRWGVNYQPLINKALREHIESVKKHTLEETLRRVIRQALRTSSYVGTKRQAVAQL